MKTSSAARPPQQFVPCPRTDAATSGPAAIRPRPDAMLSYYRDFSRV